MRDARLEMVTPLPPLPTGIAGYSADLLSAIEEPWGVSVVPERLPGKPRWVPSNRDRGGSSLQILQVGNSGFHRESFLRADAGGSLLVLHDVVLHHARLASFVERRRGRQYIELMDRLYGPEGRSAADGILRGGPIDSDRFPLSEDLIERSVLVAVHSEHARQRVLNLRPDTRVSVIPMGIPLPSLIARNTARESLNLSQDTFIIVSITHVNPMKRIPVVLRAFRRLLRFHPNSRFVIAGGASDPEGLVRQIRALGLEQHVQISGYLSDDEARLLARAADVAVNLRYPSTGETSASLLRLLGAGIPVIVTRHGSALEVPEGAALHLPVDRLEEETLAEYLIWLAGDPDARQEIGERAREFVIRHHSVGAAVDGYRSAINSAWGIHLPQISDGLVHEAPPRILTADRDPNTCVQPTRLDDTVAEHLVRLGLGGHGGTIESIANQIGRLGLDDSKSISLKQDIPPELLEVLACPVCKQPVARQGDDLVCTDCGRTFEIRNGIPVMLVSEM